MTFHYQSSYYCVDKALQRVGDRELRSIKAIEKCDYSAKGKKQIMDQYYRYCDFCDTLKVPAHPISTSMIALYCFAKVSWKNLNITNTVDLLRTKRRLTIPAWHGTDALGSESDAATLALNEFRSERKDVRVRITSPKKKIRELFCLCLPQICLRCDKSN